MEDNKISQIDKNFSNLTENGDELKNYVIPCSPFDLYGVYYEEPKGFVRMPSSVAEKVSEGVSLLYSNTSGGRIRFSTNSKKISITVMYKSFCTFPHASVLGTSGFTLLDETKDEPKFVYSFMPGYYGNESDTQFENGFSIAKTVGNGNMKNYILFFPNYNDVSSLTIGLDKDAVVKHGKTYKKVKPILYYGSSITQGACASRPDNAYQAQISKWNGIDFINLGFSGSAKAEDEMIKYLATVDCSVFVCDYDYNSPSVEHLKNTHYKLYQTFRNSQPDTPIVFVSKANTDINEEDSKLRYRVIKQTYEKAKAQGDRNVYLINGFNIYGRKDRNVYTVDGTHPNDLGFYKMAKAIYSVLKEIIG